MYLCTNRRGLAMRRSGAFRRGRGSLRGRRGALRSRGRAFGCWCAVGVAVPSSGVVVVVVPEIGVPFRGLVLPLMSGLVLDGGIVPASGVRVVPEGAVVVVRG